MEVEHAQPQGTNADGHSLQVLTALDKAKTQRFHFTTIVIAGMGFFTDAYDLICVSTVATLLGRLYFTKPGASVPGTLPPGLNSLVNGIALLGAFVGQLLFGWLGDKLGRKRVYGITAILMIFSAIASSLSFGRSATAVIATVCFFRFTLGLGIGGDYPLSATIMSEYSNTRTRGAFVGAVFANQGFGILVSAAVATIAASAMRAAYTAPAFNVDPVASNTPAADYIWRIVFLFGALPAALTFYFRTRMPETARYTALVAGNTKQAAHDMGRVLNTEFDAAAEAIASSKMRAENTYPLFSREFLRRHGLHLLGTSTTWFLGGVPWYTLNLFENYVLTGVGWEPEPASMSAIDQVYKVCRAQALIALCSIIPGYWVTIALIDRVGRKPIQLLGFLCLTILFLVMGIPYNYWRDHHRTAFVIIYAITFFFNNFGPNTTTFIVPAECFPARLRTTCHGISAAVGKLGAVLGAFGFTFWAQDPNPSLDVAGYKPGIGVGKTLCMLSGFTMLGFFMTFLVPETKGKSLEELSGESHTTHREPTGFTSSMRRRSLVINEPTV